MTPSKHLLFQLLRVSLGNKYQMTDVKDVDWASLVNYAFTQGVATLAVDGYQEIKEHYPEFVAAMDSEEMEDLRYEWFGGVLSTENEYKYKLHRAARFAKVLAQQGVECKVLKGFSFASYYKHPEHRECGDCDVYLGDGFETGNKVAKEMGGKYNFGTYKHSHLFFGSLMIENHRYLTDFAGTWQGKKIERILEARIEQQPGSGARHIESTELICPNDYFNALFLIKHAHGNFMYEGLTLRMLYDWAALLKCCQDSIDWTQMNKDLDECKLRKFTSIMTSLCVDNFGTELTCKDVETCGDGNLVAEILEDTLNCGISTIGKETFCKKCVRIGRRFIRLWHYRSIATESFPRMIWNNFVFSSYMKRKIEL